MVNDPENDKEMRQLAQADLEDALEKLKDIEEDVRHLYLILIYVLKFALIFSLLLMLRIINENFALNS